MQGNVIGESRHSSVGVGAFSVYRRGVFFIDKTKVGNFAFERRVGRAQLIGENIAAGKFFQRFVYFCGKSAFIESRLVIDKFVLFVQRDFSDERYCGLPANRGVFGNEIVVQF